MYERSNILQFRPEQTTALDAFGKAQGIFQGINKENAGIDLARAQAAHVQQQTPTDPMQRIAQFQDTMKRFPPGSPQFMYADRALAGVMSQANTGDWVPQMKGGHGGTGGLGGGGSAGMNGIGGVTGQPGALQADPTSLFRTRGMQSLQENPDGTTTVYRSGTTPVVSTLEQREAAKYESNVLQPVIQKGFSPYNGTGNGAKIATDSWEYKHGNPEQRKAAGKRLLNYVTAYNIARENVLNRMRQGGQTETGEESVAAMMKQIYPGAPLDMWIKTVPGDIITQGMSTSGDILNKASDAVQKQAALGFPTNIGKDVPASIKPGFGSPEPQTWTGIVSQLQNQQNQKLTETGVGAQPSAPKKPSKPQGVGGGVAMPTFGSKEEFQKWYGTQPSNVQEKIRKQLNRGK